jgi:hypothetical protein
MGDEQNRKTAEMSEAEAFRASRRKTAALFGPVVLGELLLLALALIYSAPLWIWLLIIAMPLLFVFGLGGAALLGFNRILGKALKVISETNKFPPNRWNYLAAGLGSGFIGTFLASVMVGPFSDLIKLEPARWFLGLALGVLAPLSLIVGGLGYAYAREWGRRLADIALLYYFLSGSLSLGLWLAASLRAIPRNGGIFLTIATITLIINLIWLSLFLQWRVGLWRPEVLAAFNRDYKPTAAKQRPLKTALLGLGLFLLGFVGLFLSGYYPAG